MIIWSGYVKKSKKKQIQDLSSACPACSCLQGLVALLLITRSFPGGGGGGGGAAAQNVTLEKFSGNVKGNFNGIMMMIIIIGRRCIGGGGFKNEHERREGKGRQSRRRREARNLFIVSHSTVKRHRKCAPPRPL